MHLEPTGQIARIPIILQEFAISLVSRALWFAFVGLGAALQVSLKFSKRPAAFSASAFTIPQQLRSCFNIK
jgi:hypothetical protein